MRYKRTLISMLALSAMSSINAAELFENNSFQATSANIAQASQTELETIRMSNTSIRDAHIYNLNAQALTESTSKLTLNLTPSLSLNVMKISTSQSTSGSMIWKGRTQVEQSASGLTSENVLLDESTILVLRNGKITGTVRTEGRLFKIQPLQSGQHLVLEIDENNMKPDHPPGAMQQLEAEMQNQPLIADQSANLNQLAVNPVIKVLVVYSNGVPAEVADIVAMTDLAIAETNQGYINSGVNATVELAHMEAINYAEVGISTDLTRLKSTSDGYMDSVHALRDQHGADIVMLLVPSNGGACGQAAAIGAVASSAFAVTAQDCATGYYSFGHEMGHLQSARHNPETDGTTTPYSFGHGYRDPASQWRTVMAYNCTSGCSRINWWSNPNKTRNGTAMGTTSKSDNTRVLNLTASTVAGFRGDTTPPPPTGSALENGIAKTNLGASSGNSLNYTFEVPAGASNINFAMNGGSGDADLYVKFGSAPTDTSYDCRPYKSGNTESCTGTQTGGTYYVRLKAYSTFSGTSITASYDTGTPGNTPIDKTYNSISVAKNQWTRYSETLAAGYSTLTVTLSGGSGDADVYVRQGNEPSLTVYDCRPYKTGNAETCTFKAPAAGTWHIGIYGYSAASGVTMNVKANP